jgi:hypothetical protein
MSRKPKLNEEAMRSELSESRFFQRRSPTADENRAPSEKRTEVSVTNLEITRTPVRPYARTLTRMPFEIYRDQHATLKRFSLEEQARGERGSMSQMVREALDMYISKRRNEE